MVKLLGADNERRPELNENTPRHPTRYCGSVLDDMAAPDWPLDSKLCPVSAQNNLSCAWGKAGSPNFSYCVPYGRSISTYLTIQLIFPSNTEAIRDGLMVVIFVGVHLFCCIHYLPRL
ncbi:hypothetical protein MA16_Dca027190 [Dendrobium catenatum]|uniref:Uncharacterized protein n=1 Tax=Dendrobium catenatum TaxID=906689 RepID=A0A2I0VDW9_9ASPA|nr:hypothetical protein MA16_Dca027190 [Dendrobium catenatum]